MFPSIQIGEDTRDSLGFRSVYFTDDNNFLWVNLQDIYNIDLIDNFDKNRKLNGRKKQINKINLVNRVKTIDFGDIRKFKKKEDFLACSFE